MIDAVHTPASTAALVAAAASLCLVPTAVWIATWSGFVTIPHVGPGRGIPYLGGPAVALAVIAGSQLAHGRSFHVALALALAIALAVVGLVDDHRPLSPIVRFLLEAIAAGIFVAVTGPLALTGTHTIDFALTVFWVVTVVNGINFLDNSDALAATVVGLAAVGLAVTAGAHTTVGVSRGHDRGCVRRVLGVQPTSRRDLPGRRRLNVSRLLVAGARRRAGPHGSSADPRNLDRGNPPRPPGPRDLHHEHAPHRARPTIDDERARQPLVRSRSSWHRHERRALRPRPRPGAAPRRRGARSQADVGGPGRRRPRGRRAGPVGHGNARCRCPRARGALDPPGTELRVRRPHRNRDRRRRRHPGNRPCLPRRECGCLDAQYGNAAASRRRHGRRSYSIRRGGATARRARTMSSDPSRSWRGSYPGSVRTSTPRT